MKNKKRQNNTKTEKQNNVFSEIKKKSNRGRGLSSPPNLNFSSNNVGKKEHSEAVDVKSKRTERISTYISREASDMLDDIIIKIKRSKGKKPKIAEVIELALIELNEKTQ